MPYLPYLKPEELQQIRDAYPPGTRVELVIDLRRSFVLGAKIWFICFA